MEHLTRQLDLVPIDRLDINITILGAGAVGSYTALALAKMGCTNIEVWDKDVVDTVNMNCQLYRFKDIRKPKVFALQEIVKDFTGIEIKAVNEFWTSQKTFRGIVLCAIDSMEARKQVFEKHDKSGYFTTHLIDARMGAESIILYTVDMRQKKSKEAYAKTLYTDENAIQERCTAKSTIYTAHLISGLVVRNIKEIIVHGNIPFMIAYDVKNNDFVEV